MTTKSTDVDERIDRAFGMLAFTVNRHLIQHMRRIALDLDMDFESAYVYGVLAHMNAAPILVPGAKPGQLLDAAGRGMRQPVPVRLADVVQVSGLPRETVRRKLEQLQRRGRVERTQDGLWQYAATGVDDRLVDWTKESIVRFLDTADELRAILGRVADRADR